MGEKKYACGVRWRNLMAKDHLDDLGLGGRVILKWI
jgi:hypothetical protein